MSEYVVRLDDGINPPLEIDRDENKNTLLQRLPTPDAMEKIYQQRYNRSPSSVRMSLLELDETSDGVSVEVHYSVPVCIKRVSA